MQKKSSLALLLWIVFFSACGAPAVNPQASPTSAQLILPPTWTPTPAASAVPTSTPIPTFTPVPAFTPLASPTHDALGELLENSQDSLFPPRGQWAAYRDGKGLKVVNAQTNQVWTLPCELFDECSVLLPVRWSRNGRILYFAPAPAESGAPPGLYLFSALAMIEARTGRWEMLLPDSDRYYNFTFSPDEDYLAYTQSSGNSASDPYVTVGILRLKNKKGPQHNLDGVFAGNIVWSPYRPRIVFQIQDPERGSSIVYFDLETGTLKYVLRDEKSDLHLSLWDENNLVSLEMKDWTTLSKSYWYLNPFTGDLQPAPRP